MDDFEISSDFKWSSKGPPAIPRFSTVKVYGKFFPDILFQLNWEDSYLNVLVVVYECMGKLWGYVYCKDWEFQSITLVFIWKNKQHKVTVFPTEQMNDGWKGQIKLDFCKKSGCEVGLTVFGNYYVKEDQN